MVYNNYGYINIIPGKNQHAGRSNETGKRRHNKQTLQRLQVLFYFAELGYYCCRLCHSCNSHCSIYLHCVSTDVSWLNRIGTIYAILSCMHQLLITHSLSIIIMCVHGQHKHHCVYVSIIYEPIRLHTFISVH